MSKISLVFLFFILALLKCIQKLEDLIICEHNAVGHSKPKVNSLKILLMLM